MPEFPITPVWINGQPNNRLPVNDRGLAYGDGVFETLRIVSGQPFLARLHWQRLQQSCERLAIPLDIELVIDEVSRFLQQCQAPNAILKLIVTRGSGGRGYNPEDCQNPTRCLSLHPLPQRKTNPAICGARVTPCQLQLGRSALAGIKHLNRLEQVLARSEWQGANWDEGVVCDFDGYLIEGTMSNLFMVTRDGRLLTPDLSRCGVAGVCRAFILEQADSLGLITKTGFYPATLLDSAEITEVFLCNSVNAVWPVIEYAEQLWPIGPVTIRIRDYLLKELKKLEE